MNAAIVGIVALWVIVAIAEFFSRIDDTPSMSYAVARVITLPVRMIIILVKASAHTIRDDYIS